MQPNELVVVHECDPKPSDLSLIKLATFMGVPVRGVSVAGNADGRGSEILHVMRDAGCVAVGAHTLRQCLSRSSLPNMLQSMDVGPTTKLFVYGFGLGSGESELVRALSSGSFSSLRRPDASENQYCVSTNSKSFCQEFCGLTFGPINRTNDLIFERTNGDQRTFDYVRIGDRPFLVGIRNSESLIVLAGTRHILDIDIYVHRGMRLLNWFSQLVPPMLFLRYVFGESCWRGAQKLACFIVDDPLLRRRHGSLDYNSLIEVMELTNFTTSIAFIPWNYKRSDPKVAELFRGHSGLLSLSIHGCDHTKEEFGGTQEAVLLCKAKIAQNRMIRHRQLTGVSYDNVMVFPQGAFSTAALKALKKTNYLAAVNSTPYSMDNPPRLLRVHDLLTPAVMCYSGFPIFIRRYPNSIADFAFDLFLGKPALIVEHHEYFRDGCRKLEDFAGKINGLCGELEWCGLEEIARKSCLRRADADGVVHVRFFSDHCVVRNDWPTPRRFKFSRFLGPDQLEPPPVAVDGKHVTAAKMEGELCFEWVLQPGEQVVIELGVPDAPVEAVLRSGSVWYRAKVFARRHLCELRDNYVCRIRLFGSDWSPRKTVMRQN